MRASAEAAVDINSDDRPHLCRRLQMLDLPRVAIVGSGRACHSTPILTCHKSYSNAVITLL